MKAHTDGSATLKTVGVRIYIKYPERQVYAKTMPTGHQGKNNINKVEALIYAANTISCKVDIESPMLSQS
ncbi:hypothetical protein DPMN_005662 [Dreissena polymorpha]|uniref:Uncharacterized protein n=1 Tax=Dreissena polymorpha TaxID=45954 RepID=A0A9D4MQU2_DREPO|nr:hypothetical protein DPMN_005662 [Dreissena polymorpha]